MNKREIRRYYRQIRSWLPCSSKMKHQILSEIHSSVTRFTEEHPEADFAALQSQLGTPQEIAAAYVENTGTLEILKDLRIRRRVARIVASVMLAALLMWTGLITSSWIAMNANANGYIVVTIE